jgi:hypothetical protein
VSALDVAKGLGRGTVLTVIAHLLVGSLLAACGGGGAADPPASNESGVVASGVPLIGSLQLAASDGGPAWVVWGEGDVTADSIAAAAVDPSGMVSRSIVFPRTPGAQRDVQVKISGSVPVVAWRSYAEFGNSVHVRVSAYAAGRWNDELVAPASLYGAPQLIVQPDGTLSLLWQRTGAAGSSELVFSKRSSAGQWSTPVVVATAQSGIEMGIPRHAAAVGGSMLALWTEAPVSTSSAPQPQVLLASRFDPSAGAWEAAAPVDSQNGLYYVPDVAPAANGEWVVVWKSGTPSRQPSLLSRRWVGGAWADPVRIDAGADHSIREVTLSSDGQFMQLVWTGLSEFISPGNVRTSTFDTVQSSWSPIALLGHAARGYPQRPRLTSAAGGRAVAVWEVTQGDIGGPFVAERATSGAWGASRLLVPGVETGFVADVVLPSASGAVALWYRNGAQASDIFLHRWTLSGN